MQTFIITCSRLVAMFLMSSLPAIAFAQPTYAPTRSYGTPQRQGLDPNYGLPSFGMRGSELPRQRTMASPPEAPSSSALDFMNSDPPADADDLDLKPKRPGLASAGETPLYTTPTDTTSDPAESRSDSYGKPDSFGRPDSLDRSQSR